jgi:hypothetical protein
MEIYIFLTDEGFTFQPDTDSDMPKFENLQVIGFASGDTAVEAFSNLLVDYSYLKETTFDHVFCYRLDKSYENTRRDFHLKT